MGVLADAQVVLSVKPEEQRYASELGDQALARQQQARRERCVLCWAPHGEAHAETCPNRPADEEPLQPDQDEALF